VRVHTSLGAIRNSHWGPLNKVDEGGTIMLEGRQTNSVKSLPVIETEAEAERAACN